MAEGAATDAQLGKLIRPVLRGMNATSPEIEASAAISTDGFIIAAVLGEGIGEERFGAMCASLLALAERAAQEIDRGQLRQVLVDGEKGTMLLVRCGTDAVLAVAAKPTANLGMVFIEARKTAFKIQSVLSVW